MGKGITTTDGYKTARSAGRASGGSRRHNRAVVLELIRGLGPVSRTEVARAATLSMPTVVEIVERLMREDFIREVGQGSSTGGRRPILLQLVPEARCAIGVEVGTRRLTATVTDLNASVKARITAPSEMSRGPGATLEQVSTILAQLRREVPEGLGEAMGIGVAVPAPILASTDMVFSPPSYPGWGEARIGDAIAERHDLPVVVDNDANARALGEHLFGAGRGGGVGNMFYMVAHRGIGGAIIMDGDLRRGFEGGAGEIGHTVIDVDGPQCGCGKYGCLEAFAGRAAIARRASRALKLAGGGSINGRDADQVKAKDVIQAALEGDELAAGVLEETGKYLGIGVSNVANFLDPELIVVGGPTMQAGELVLGPLTETVRRRALPTVARRVEVSAGELGEDAGAVGAAALVLRELFAVSVPHGREQSRKSGAAELVARRSG